MKKWITELILACVLLLCFGILSKEAVEILRATEKKDIIVIDAGHGGIDPGVVGWNDIEEKDINLLITLKLKKILEENGYEVRLTRESDKGLYADASNEMKTQDMQNRVKFVENIKPILMVSIHQNSFPDKNVYGPQVFFYEKSGDGKILAENIQEVLNKELEIVKPREIKSNVSYYLLKEVTIPIAIVECGFLTNPSEAVLLVNDEYQNKIAAAIAKGIKKYLEIKGEPIIQENVTR